MIQQIESLLRTHDFLLRQINGLRYSLTRFDAELQMIQMVLANVSIQAEAIQQLNQQRDQEG